MSRSKSHSRLMSRSQSQRISRSRKTSRSISRPASRHSRSRSKTPVDTYRLHIKNIGVRVTIRDIKNEFGQYGTLLNVWMAMIKPRFAFVVYKRDKDAAEAQRNTNGMAMRGRFITVSFAITRGFSRKSSRIYSNRNLSRCYSCNKLGHYSRNCKEVNNSYKR